MIAKTAPFGSHLSTKLESANNKLVCALSSATTCTDDTQTLPFRPDPFDPVLLEPIA